MSSDAGLQFQPFVGIIWHYIIACTSTLIIIVIMIITSFAKSSAIWRRDGAVLDFPSYSSELGVFKDWNDEALSRLSGVEPSSHTARTSLRECSAPFSLGQSYAETLNEWRRRFELHETQSFC